jgi:hypothetical protein
MATHVLVDTDSTQTLTNKTLTAPAISAPVLSGTTTGTYTLGGTPTVSAPTLSGTVTLTGGQLVFPATQVPSGGANTLDDYEEGTWTPAVGGSATYTTQTGTYTKIGRAVFITCRLTINSIGTGSANTISGLPFTVGSAGIGPVRWASGAASPDVLNAYAAAGTTTVTMVGTTAPGASDTTINILGNSADVIFSLFFFV